MWNLKFKVKNTDIVYTPLTEKYKIIDYMYPVDRFKKDNKIFMLSIHVLDGEEKEIKKFTQAFKKNKKVKEFEKNENRIVALIAEEEKFYDLLYNPELYLPSPVLIKDGYELWNIAAWKREILQELISEIEKWDKKLYDFELLQLKKGTLKEIYFPKILPILPPKQKQAFQFAITHHYYTFHRKANLGHLAKIANVSTQTFQENLRKAEAKLLPFFAEDIL
ncbi:helix-turn-helix domain-containing protein [Candidatus Pacearchaeota archaeon]|nr:helix-turn-helix domain-containing protein [Candidatus Pacearchaeota archaeon]